MCGKLALQNLQIFHAIVLCVEIAFGAKMVTISTRNMKLWDFVNHQAILKININSEISRIHWPVRSVSPIQLINQYKHA